MKRTSLLSAGSRTLVVCGVALSIGSACTLRDLTIGKDRDASILPSLGKDAASVLPDATGIDRPPDPPPPIADSGSGADSIGPLEPPTVVDAASVDGAVACPNTAPGVDNCGPNCESCSTSPLVPGGTFYRSYDGVLYTDVGNPATVSSFRLDKYEITVGRFRKFVEAVVSGWRPAAGAGKHTHLNSGQGLADSSSLVAFESGWNSVWNNNLFGTSSGWNASLACLGITSGNAPAGTWTPSPASNESLPIGCLNWYQAYAFCTWDGGFLPSEAEWNYAASGGDEQRVYPWSSPANSQTADCTYANFAPNQSSGPNGAGGVSGATSRGVPCVLSGPLPAGSTGVGTAGPNRVGSESPRGDARWGQSDIAGNVLEWTMDWHVNYAVPCLDCAYLGTIAEPVVTKETRGGSFLSTGQGTLNVVASAAGSYTLGSVLAADREVANPTVNVSMLGARCARAP